MIILKMLNGYKLNDRHKNFDDQWEINNQRNDHVQSDQ